MSAKNDIDKADIANWIAAGLIASGMAFGILTLNIELVTAGLGAGIGYLFGRAAKNSNSARK